MASAERPPIDWQKILVAPGCTPSPSGKGCVTDRCFRLYSYVWPLWMLVVLGKALAALLFGCPRVHHTKDGSCSLDVELEEDDDVLAERRRVLGEAGGSGDDVKLLGLRKKFSRMPRPAVDDLTVGIEAGTCFALLGPNGAGKTTAINMLTGDVFPSAGSATLCGLRTSEHLLDVFKLTGFCPQFKGLWDSLTVREHLTVYLSLKGLEGETLLRVVEQVARGYGLTEHADKQVKKCSGGTQRKLSAAIALSCGRPRITFLDEPTTGVDVGTRRFIWDRIKEGTAGRVVLLTTHYMDEADALAHRIGIMVHGKLAVLGSPQHLKTRHGGGYRVELKAPRESAERLAALVHTHFESVKLIESHEGLQTFEVAQGFSRATVFAAMERAKAELGLENYTLTQTTLEAVFLRIVDKSDKDARDGKDEPQSPARAVV
jgi:ABC-type multidrug transport system ATPase subunit